jgi:hypothetical protein
MQSIIALWASLTISILAFFGISKSHTNFETSPTSVMTEASSSPVTVNENDMKRDTSKDVIVKIDNPNCLDHIDDKKEKFGYNIVINQNRIFAENKLLEGVDAGSFTCVGYVNAFGDGGGYWQSYYFKDKNKVYILRFDSEDSTSASFYEIKADAKTFTYVGESIFTDAGHELGFPDSYAKDIHHVYSGQDMISELDPATFEVLGSGYIKDKNTVANFASMTGDGNHFIPKADPASFVVLGDGYAKDKNFAYYYGTIINGADAATFSLSPGKNNGEYGHYAKDKYSRYSTGERI